MATYSSNTIISTFLPSLTHEVIYYILYNIFPEWNFTVSMIVCNISYNSLEQTYLFNHCNFLMHMLYIFIIISTISTSRIPNNIYVTCYSHHASIFPQRNLTIPVKLVTKFIRNIHTCIFFQSYLRGNNKLINLIIPMRIFLLLIYHVALNIEN